ncbi:MAG: hypothetical protein ABIK85_03825 [Candidatus Eisenbacteria bacterium]
MTQRVAYAVLVTAVLSAAFAVPALGAVACSATGEAVPYSSNAWTYNIYVTWDFKEAALPEHFSLSLEHLDDCFHFDPDNPNQEDYIVLRRGFSEASPGCVDTEGVARSMLLWESELAFENLDCWMPSRHLTWRNNGLTEPCDPLPADVAHLRFVSPGVPIGPTMYYDTIVIKADDGTCVVCDYFGPLPDCNWWNPVEPTTWGTVKALYR